MNRFGLRRLGGARLLLSSPQPAGPLAPPAHTPKLGVTHVHFGFIGEVTRRLTARGDARTEVVEFGCNDVETS
jgi:hypothetical protein